MEGLTLLRKSASGPVQSRAGKPQGAPGLLWMPLKRPLNQPKMVPRGDLGGFRGAIWGGSCGIPRRKRFPRRPKEGSGGGLGSILGESGLHFGSFLMIFEDLLGCILGTRPDVQNSLYITSPILKPCPRSLNRCPGPPQISLAAGTSAESR